MIVRSTDPNEIVTSVSRCIPRDVRYIQLLSTPADTSVLEGEFYSLPVDIHLSEPAIEYPELYNYANLLDSHPIRVSVEVWPGFSKAVRLAVSLNFAVKLEMVQPNDKLIEELESVLDLYLHRSNVRQAIEFFHSLLLSFWRNEPVSVWEISEDDPSQVRYITDDGKEMISRRFIDRGEIAAPDQYSELLQRHIASSSDCAECQFFNRCRGYFKWPDASYDCTGVKRIFGTLESSAKELQQDLAGYREMEVQI